MSRKKPTVRSSRRRDFTRVCNSTLFDELLQFVLPDGALFSKTEFHGNIEWIPERLTAQALIWSWQDSKYVTEAFDKTLEVCERIKLTKGATNYTTFMNALSRYRGVIGERLRLRHQKLAREIGGRFVLTDSWMLIGFDGSRATAPRTVANEKAFCAPNYGHGKEAKYGKKKSEGFRRERNKACPPEPPEPQVWITLMWHMGLRLPWTWRLGPSNSSERKHVQEILEQEEFSENTLFCGDAGFVGYSIWKSIRDIGQDFLVRVGANVKLLSEQIHMQSLGDGIVLCWPKDKIKAGEPPLRLRLVQVRVGKTKMWMLTSVLNGRKLTNQQIIRYYKLRWGIEVEFRGLKQTIDKHKLRCRNNDRLLAELDWSLRGMAIAELIALRQQIPATAKQPPHDVPGNRSLANTLRALRTCLRNLDQTADPEDNLMAQLSHATIQRYNNRTDKRPRYRPKNPDIKPLGDPVVRPLTPDERGKLHKYSIKNLA